MGNRRRSISVAAVTGVALLSPFPAASAQTPISEFWRITEGDTDTDSPADLVLDANGVAYITGYQKTGSTTSAFYTLRYTPERNGSNEPNGQDDALGPARTPVSLKRRRWRFSGRPSTLSVRRRVPAATWT